MPVLHQQLLLCVLLLGTIVVFATIRAEEIQQLVRCIKQSDNAAFKSVFDAFHQPIFRFLQFKMNDGDAAEDVVQDVFVKLWENRHQLDENRSLKSYLYTIANNLALNYFRHENVVRKAQDEQLRLSPAIETPETLFEQQEFSGRLRNAINQISEKPRTVFLMSRVEQLSYKEIAERLEISVKTVESHIGHSLKTLRRLLAGNV